MKSLERQVPLDLPVDPDATYDPGAGTAAGSNPVRDQFLETVILASDPKPSRSSSPPPRQPREEQPDSTSRFILSHKIGEGGFGEVWQAEQASLSRHIAVKRLKHNLGTVDTGIFTGDLRQAEIRFRQEALTTAQLQHPNIVPVHDFGLDADGRPLLAMKLVNGRDWRQSLSEDFRTLPGDEYLARHLQVLINVTQAVAFAHSRGIIHRDLKPAQVMLGAYGEVLLMDWGLAMAWPLPDVVPGPDLPPAQDSRPFSLPIPPESPLFRPLNPAGTVAYMAPEQTDEGPERLGPWTDVWLLGAILYEVLTGSPPHVSKNSADAFRIAREGYVPPPGERVCGREVPRQLAALAMKALERRPADRVASAQAFLEGVQSYLTGADKRRESLELTEKVKSRWVEATDYGVISHSLNLLERALILWPGNLVAAELRQRAIAHYARAALHQNDLKLARMQAERLDAGPVKEALREELEVRQEMRRIEKARYADALRQAKADRERAEGLVRFLLDDLHAALKSIGRLDIVRTVTQQTLGYFDSLEDTEVTEATLYNRSIAYLNIGDLLSSEGKKPEAQEAYRKARDLARQLVEIDGSNVDYLLGLADTHERHGRILYYQGRADDAEQDQLSALDVRRGLADSWPFPCGHEMYNGRPDRLQLALRVQTALASSHHELGIIAWRQQQLDQAHVLQSASLELYTQLLECAQEAGAEPMKGPAGALADDLRSRIGWNLSTLANVYRDQGNLEEALRLTRQGLEIRSALAAEQPSNASRAEDMMWTRSNLGLLLLLRGELEESLAVFTEDMETRRRLSREDPGNVVRLGALVFPLSMVGEIQLMLNRLEEAEATLRDCLDVSRQLIARDSTSTWALGGYAIQASQLSDILIATGRWAEASPLVKLGLSRARQVATVAPRNATFQLALARCLVLHGRLVEHESRSSPGGEEGKQGPVQALEFWNEALQLVQSVEAAGEELALMDLKAQLFHLLGRSDEAAPLMEELRRRRWISPYLARITGQAAVPGTLPA